MAKNISLSISKGVPMALEISHNVLSIKYSMAASITVSKLVRVFDVVLKHWKPSSIQRD